jgi:membrane protein DedA with SNARE-associated domain/membrane-associated phospholipid phosphatase
MELIDYILPKIEHFRLLGYWVVLLVSFLESRGFVGLLVPGSVFLVVVGSLAAAGYFDLGGFIWFAVAGAVLGDGISFVLGKRGHILFSDDNRIFKASYLAKGQDFFTRHGGKSVFLGRFIGFVRPIIPFVAGLSHMEAKRFYLWNILSALLWAPAFLLPGYFFGHAWRMVEIWSSRAGIFLAGMFVFLLGVYFLKRFVLKRGRELLAFISPILSSIRQAIVTEPNVRRLVNNHPLVFAFIRNRLDKSQFSGLPLTLLGCAFLYTLLLLFGVIEDVLTLDPIVAVDTRIANLLYVYRDPAPIKVFLWITLLGKAKMVLCLAALCTLLFWIWRKRAFILPLWITIAGSGIFNPLGKVAFHRPRPAGIGVYTEASFSFPSGHATFAAAFYGFIVYFLWRQTKTWQNRLNVLFAGLLLILAIGFSRLYLGVHFVSDVLGGYLLGLLWLIIGICIAEWSIFDKTPQQERRPLPFRGKMLAAGAILAGLVFYAHSGIHYRPPSQLSASRKTLIIVSRDILAGFNRQQLPRQTETITGEKQQPLSVITVASDDEALTSAFKSAGWQPAEPVGVGSLVKTAHALIVNESYPTAPIAPSFWNGKVQDLSFQKPTPANSARERHHVRFWRTNLTTEDNRRVYVGTAGFDTGLKWGIVHRTRPDIDTEREGLLKDLVNVGGVVGYQKYQFTEPVTGRNFTGDPFFSDGMLYVVSLQIANRKGKL